MRVSLKTGGHSPRIKPPLAGVATPRPRSIHTVQEIQDAVAMRSKTINASALWTDHRTPCSATFTHNAEYRKPNARARLRLCKTSVKKVQEFFAASVESLARSPLLHRAARPCAD